jgi:hypothetical protein
MVEVHSLGQHPTGNVKADYGNAFINQGLGDDSGTCTNIKYWFARVKPRQQDGSD